MAMSISAFTLAPSQRITAGTGSTEPGRTVTTGPDAEYFGTPLAGRELTPGDGAELSALGYAEWAARA